MTTAEDQFRDALRSRNIIPPDQLIGDGAIHRCDAEGRNGKGDAAYLLHLDGIPAGGFENHRDGLAWENWRADIGRPLAPVEAAAHAELVRTMREQREADLARARAEAQQRAIQIWKDAEVDAGTHPYVVRKGVKPHGVRLHKGALAIPMRDAQGQIHSLQFIDSEGDKRYLTGGRKAGCYFSIGKPAGTIVIAEGFATGASVHEATGNAVAVAFDATNLLPVAKALRETYPDLNIVIAADDDWKTGGNPGITKAAEAAAAVGGLVAIPVFRNDRPDSATDFNDLAVLSGQDAVKRCVGDAKAPAASVPIPTSPSAPEAILGGRVWPMPMDEAAFHGLAGEFVKMVEPNTESDSAALLVQALVAFGAFVARGPHYLVEGDEHHCNLFVTIVGESSKARKGTSQSRIRRVFERIQGWKPHVSGLSSGEGIKYHVRDPREESKTDKHGVTTLEIVDAGVTDKRLLVVEPEFASVLRATQRQGNTLSATIREAWDSGNLRSLVKNDPVTATGAHVSIVGHITSDELRSELTATDTANGFANRFLFVAAKRSKMLPFGGERTSEADEAEMARRFGEAAELARGRGRVTMTEGARSIWQAVYPALSEGGGGLHGAVTARAEAQVIRLSLVYCLLDSAPQIDAPHLLAALAVWQYCDATAKYVFGASLGDRIADEILRRLRNAGETGLTRTEIRDAFGRHESAERIGIALEMLAGKHLIVCGRLMTGGRPTENWSVAK